MVETLIITVAFFAGTVAGMLVMSLMFMARDDESREAQYRVWPDGTVQCPEDGEYPYSWMSDDYLTVWAYDEQDALNKANTSPPRKQ